MARPSLLREVNDNTDRWSIIVRVFRKWNVYQKSSPSELFCTTMILVDEEGTKIQATVIPRNSNDTFRHSLDEGKIYFLANFIVSQNSNQYKATTHPFKIIFTQQTFAREEAANIPLNAYAFLPIVEILSSQERNFADHLIDVVAFVKSVGSLEEYRRDNETKHKLRMLLTDMDDNDIECVLFDECSTNAYMAQLENMDTPVIAVINLARIAFSEDSRAQVCSSFNATRVFFNPPIAEVKDLVERAKDKASPITSCLSQIMQGQSSQQSSASILRNNSRISLSEITQQKIGESFVVYCVIKKLETRHGWTYDGCAKCASKPRDEGNELVCPNCKKKPEIVEPKLKVHYTAIDEIGTASVVFWDKLASQLLEKSAAELKQILISTQREYDFPDQCDSVIGKRMLLKLKRNEFNAKHIGSSISVQQFTLCEDLNEQFNAVSSDEAEVATLNPSEVILEPPVQVQDITKDVEVSQAISSQETSQIAAASLDAIKRLPSQTPAAAPPKGKRKAYMKRTNVDHEVNVQLSSASVSPPADRLLKVVKQEKK